MLSSENQINGFKRRKNVKQGLSYKNEVLYALATLYS
jgi:hypothetical protein